MVRRKVEWMSYSCTQLHCTHIVLETICINCNHPIVPSTLRRRRRLSHTSHRFHFCSQKIHHNLSNHSLVDFFCSFFPPPHSLALFQFAFFKFHLFPNSITLLKSQLRTHGHGEKSINHTHAIYDFSLIYIQ